MPGTLTAGVIASIGWGKYLLMNNLENMIDLELAYRRVKIDISNERVFIPNTFELDLVDIDSESWLRAIRDQIAQGMYNPDANAIIEIPKSGGLIRPGSNLCLTDCIIYTSLAQAILPEALQALSWSQGRIDYSYILTGDGDSPKWFRHKFEGWVSFREKSIEKIDAGSSHIVIADISAFYDSISIRLLISDLAQLGIPAEIQNQISSCLNRWAIVPSRGIPQGYSASDLLAKIYINSIDENFRNLAYDHYRYVDDFRIFCNSDIEAKKAIIDLSRLLRTRGLNLQTAKTKILASDAARECIEGVAPIIKEVGKKFVDEIGAEYLAGHPYMSIALAERFLSENPKSAPIEVIKETYTRHFIDADNQEFDSTLFHYLLRGLGTQEDDLALEHTKWLLAEHPEETAEIIRYWSRLGIQVKLDTFLVDFFGSDEAIYDYQSYLLAKWVLEEFDSISSALLSIFRAKSFNENLPDYFLGPCRMVLGEFGTHADLENLRNLYPHVHGQLQKSELIYSLRRLETGLRNEFISRVQGDGDLQSRAARLVRS